MMDTSWRRMPRRASAGALAAAIALTMGIGGAAAQEIGPRSVADLADKLLPAVVNISTAQRPRRTIIWPGAASACASSADGRVCSIPSGTSAAPRSAPLRGCGATGRASDS